MIYEFPKNYVNDPSDTAAIGSGSGVHLEKGVFFNFGFTDRQTTRMENITQLNENPFFSGYQLDILDISGNDVFTGYRVNSIEPNFNLDEQKNIDLFGEYTKDFGIRLTVADLTTATTTTSEIYTYGNKAFFNSAQVTDGTGTRNYTGQSDFSSYTGTGYGSTTATGYILINVSFSGQPHYTKYERIDLYYSTGSGVSISTENFYKSFSIFEQNREASIRVNMEKTAAHVDYYFKAVPFSAIGSGDPWNIGPHFITQTPSSGSSIDTSEINLIEGSAVANFDLQTGVITNVYSPIHILSTGDYKSVEYHIQVTDDLNLSYTHKAIVTHTGTGLTDYSLSEYAISDESHLELEVTSGLRARVTNAAYSPATYKLFKMSM